MFGLAQQVFVVGIVWTYLLHFGNDEDTICQDSAVARSRLVLVILSSFLQGGQGIEICLLEHDLGGPNAFQFLRLAMCFLHDTLVLSQVLHDHAAIINVAAFGTAAAAAASTAASSAGAAERGGRTAQVAVALTVRQDGHLGRQSRWLPQRLFLRGGRQNPLVLGRFPLVAIASLFWFLLGRHDHFVGRRSRRGRRRSS